MNITVFGTGYVGLVAAACLADAGHHIICVDVNSAKIEELKKGTISLYEPGLDVLVKKTSNIGV